MALSGDDISALYEAHATAVLKFAMRRTLDAQISIDLVGETFAVAFEQRRRYRGSTDGAAQSWLFGIASNLLKMYFRDGAIERRAMDRLGIEPVEVPEHEFERIESLAGSAVMRGAVRGALAELSAEQRTAVRLRVVDELPYPLVAQRLEITEEVARARVSRGLRKLREHLDSLQLDEVMENV